MDDEKGRKMFRGWDDRGDLVRSVDRGGGTGQWAQERRDWGVFYLRLREIEINRLAGEALLGRRQ